jgi:hypothetical protein
VAGHKPAMGSVRQNQAVAFLHPLLHRPSACKLLAVGSLEGSNAGHKVGDGR